MATFFNDFDVNFFITILSLAASLFAGYYAWKTYRYEKQRDQDLRARNTLLQVEKVGLHPFSEFTLFYIEVIINNISDHSVILLGSGFNLYAREGRRFWSEYKINVSLKGDIAGARLSGSDKCPNFDAVIASLMYEERFHIVFWDVEAKEFTNPILKKLQPGEGCYWEVYLLIPKEFIKAAKEDNISLQKMGFFVRTQEGTTYHETSLRYNMYYPKEVHRLRLKKYSSYYNK